MYVNQNEVNKIREEYPKGTRLECVHMKDPYPILAGVRGTVKMVDDAGQVHVAWDNGSTLALIVGEDEFNKVLD